MRTPLSRDECHSESLVVLVEVCQKFDPAKLTTKPSTWLWARMRQRMLDYARQELGRCTAEQVENGTVTNHKAKARLNGTIPLDAVNGQGRLIYEHFHPVEAETPETVAIRECEIGIIMAEVDKLSERERDFLLAKTDDDNVRFHKMEEKWGLRPKTGGGYHWLDKAREKVRKHLDD